MGVDHAAVVQAILEAAAETALAETHFGDIFRPESVKLLRRSRTRSALALDVIEPHAQALGGHVVQQFLPVGGLAAGLRYGFQGEESFAARSTTRQADGRCTRGVQRSGLKPLLWGEPRGFRGVGEPSRPGVPWGE